MLATGANLALQLAFSCDQFPLVACYVTGADGSTVVFFAFDCNCYRSIGLNSNLPCWSISVDLLFVTGAVGSTVIFLIDPLVASTGAVASLVLISCYLAGAALNSSLLLVVDSFIDSSSTDTSIDRVLYFLCFIGSSCSSFYRSSAQQ